MSTTNRELASQLGSPATPAMERNLAEYAHDAAPVLAALSAAGHPLEDLQDVLRLQVLPKAIVPVLLEWLPRVVLPNVKDTIVRALTDRAARPAAARPLLAEFARTKADDGYKWSLGNAMTVVADDSVFDDIANLVQEPAHGKAREMLAVALGNMKDPRASTLLVRLLADEQLSGHAVMGLSKLADPSTREHIAPLLRHPTTWVRRKAEHAVARIDKKVAKVRATKL